MNRRQFLKQAAAAGFLPALGAQVTTSAGAQHTAARAAHSRVRPSDPGWPSEASWSRLRQDVGGRLIEVQWPLDACRQAPGSAACGDVFKGLKNPYYIGDHPGLTQTSGWLDAWTSAPSVYAVAARRTEDVVAAVNFAREHNLRLVIKGGGHSYQGTSNAPDSLLIWTREMNGITLHDAFVGRGCEGAQAPQPAVTIGAGAIWRDAYNAVTTRGGRYVQGGGCLTVGVAGLVLSGGFGSFSKNYGLASAALLEAEIVTADGAVRIANPCTHPDLFWAIKGGGGGNLGVVTQLTLKTRDLPAYFGAAFGRIRAASDAAFRALVARTLRFYRESLFNPHWGEQIIFEPGNAIRIAMVFQGLDQQQAEAAWKPFLDWLAASSQHYSVENALTILSLPARHGWDVEYIRKGAPDLIAADDRPSAPKDNVYWAGNSGEIGQFLHGYKSAWLPASLLRDDQQQRLADALLACTRHWAVSLHFNKGLAGAPTAEVEAAKDTAMNPAVLDAFALAIIAGQGPPAFPGIPGHQPDLPAARRRAASIRKAADELLKVAPNAGSYVSESDYFESAWQQSFWGGNYQRLAVIKKTYDPQGLFFVHHGVGSDEWSADGITRLTGR
jgi:FAD/FMN-containing dehydrogenase